MPSKVKHYCLICHTDIDVHKHHFFKDKDGNPIEYVPQQYHWIPEPLVYLCEPCHNRYENQPPDFFFNPAKRKEIIKSMELFGINTDSFNSIIAERKAIIMESYPIVSSHIISQIKHDGNIPTSITTPLYISKRKARRKTRMINCIDCGESFFSASPNAKYCPSCRKKRFVRKREPRQLFCEYPPCGRSIFTSQPTRKYCCGKHRVADFRRKIEQELLLEEMLKESAAK